MAPTDPESEMLAEGARAAVSGPGAGSGAGSLGSSLGASLVVHGAVVASLVLTWTAAHPPREPGGPRTVEARVALPAPPTFEVEVDEVLEELRDRTIDETPEVVPLEAPEPVSDPFAETTGPAPEPAPWVDPFDDPEAVLDGVRVRVRTRPEPPPRVAEPIVASDAPTEAAADSPETEPASASPEPLEGSCPPPAYPRVAQRRGWQGTVVLLIDVGIDGRVTDVRIESSSGHGLLDDAAVEAAREWRFRPGLTAGEPTATTVRKPIQFGE